MFNLEDYETVEERLAKFWKEHPDGRIYTTLVEHTLQRFIVQAAIYRTEVDAHPWTTGYAEETVSTRGVNSTSALENCETSAIGRALANANYASKGKRPSREEMEKVARAQQSSQNPSSPPKQAMTEGDWNNLLSELNQCGSEEQLKVWSALAATFAMPEDKRLLLIQIYQEQKKSLSPAPVTETKKKSVKAEPVA